jgi:hypothetical protein
MGPSGWLNMAQKIQFRRGNVKFELDNDVAKSGFNWTMVEGQE